MATPKPEKGDRSRLIHDYGRSRPLSLSRPLSAPLFPDVNFCNKMKVFLMKLFKGNRSNPTCLPKCCCCCHRSGIYGVGANKHNPHGPAGQPSPVLFSALIEMIDRPWRPDGERVRRVSIPTSTLRGPSAIRRRVDAAHRTAGPAIADRTPLYPCQTQDLNNAITALERIVPSYRPGSSSSAAPQYGWIIANACEKISSYWGHQPGGAKKIIAPSRCDGYQSRVG